MSSSAIHGTEWRSRLGLPPVSPLRRCEPDRRALGNLPAQDVAKAFERVDDVRQLLKAWRDRGIPHRDILEAIEEVVR